MKEYIKKTLLCIVPLLFAGNFLLANDVYVTQSGDTLDLDITQDGQNNTLSVILLLLPVRQVPPLLWILTKSEIVM